MFSSAGRCSSARVHGQVVAVAVTRPPTNVHPNRQVGVVPPEEMQVVEPEIGSGVTRWKAGMRGSCEDTTSSDRPAWAGRRYPRLVTFMKVCPSVPCSANRLELHAPARQQEGGSASIYARKNGDRDETAQCPGWQQRINVETGEAPPIPHFKCPVSPAVRALRPPAAAPSAARPRQPAVAVVPEGSARPRNKGNLAGGGVVRMVQVGWWSCMAGATERLAQKMWHNQECRWRLSEALPAHA